MKQIKATFIIAAVCAALGYTAQGTAAEGEEQFTYQYDSFENRDIMKPLVNERGQILIKEKLGVGNFVLQGIMDYPDGSRVVINGEILAEGEVFEGYRIKKIENKKVILEKDGEDFSLNWEGE